MLPASSEAQHANAPIYAEWSRNPVALEVLADRALALGAGGRPRNG
jgi:hypothetical protein